MPEGRWRIRADVSQFETALVNLAVDARAAMNGRGDVTIRLRGDAAMPASRGHGAGTGHFVAISLPDSGSGIAPDHLEHILSPFLTTEAVGKGTGAGLSQVFGFAKQSGGDVDVESAPGERATSTLYLLYADVDAAPEERVAGQPQDTHGQGRCVVAIGDNVSVGQFATQLLEDLGFRTRWVTSAEEALERLGPDGAGFDIVFSDVVVPGSGGIALAKRLVRDLARCPSCWPAATAMS